MCCKNGDSCRRLNIAWDVHYFVEAKGNVVKAHGTVYFASGMEKEALHSLCLLNMEKVREGRRHRAKGSTAAIENNVQSQQHRVNGNVKHNPCTLCYSIECLLATPRLSALFQKKSFSTHVRQLCSIAVQKKVYDFLLSQVITGND